MITSRFALELCIKENKRIFEVEPIILINSYRSYLYAKHVIKGRWPEAEPIILTNAWACYNYAKNILHKRWLEAEPFIKKNEFYWKIYCQHFNIRKDQVNWKVGL